MEAIIMACAITSLMLFAMFGVVAAGLALRPSLKGSPPARRDRTSAAPGSGGSVMAN